MRLPPGPKSDITNVNNIDRLVDLIQGTMVEAHERSCGLSVTTGSCVMSKTLEKIQKNCEIEPWTICRPGHNFRNEATISKHESFRNYCTDVEGAQDVSRLNSVVDDISESTPDTSLDSDFFTVWKITCMEFSKYLTANQNLL